MKISGPAALVVVGALLAHPTIGAPAMSSIDNSSSTTTGVWTLHGFAGLHGPDYPSCYYTASPDGSAIYALAVRAHDRMADSLWVLDPRSDAGWQVYPTQGQVPGKLYGQAKMVFDPARRQVVLLGPYLVSTAAQLWTLEVDGERRWSHVTVHGLESPNRLRPSLLIDTKRDRLILFGGMHSVERPLNDVWTLPLDGTGGWEWQQLVPRGDPLPARSDAAVALLPGNDRMIVFGGLSPTGYINDLWELRFDDPPSWRPVLHASIAPEPQSDPAMVADAASGELAVLTGTQGPTPQVWRLTVGQDAEWRALPTGENSIVPTVRRDVMLAPAGPDHEFLLFGGESRTLNLRDPSIWRLNTRSEPIWSFVRGEPIPREKAALALDPLRRRLVLFGGESPHDPMDELWVYDIEEGRWSPQPKTSPWPSARSGHALLYDPKRDRFVLFGGESRTDSGSSDYPREVWTLSPTDWSWSRLESPTVAPPGRTNLRATWDAVGDRMFVLGGSYYGVGACGGRTWYRSDVWSWSAVENRWTEMPHLHFGPNADFEAIHDPVSPSVLMVAGIRNSASCGDGYDWNTTYYRELRQLDPDGSNGSFTVLPAVGTNLARHFTGGVYDPIADSFLTFGGYDETHQTSSLALAAFRLGPEGPAWFTIPTSAPGPTEVSLRVSVAFDPTSRTLWTYVPGRYNLLDGALWSLQLTGGPVVSVSIGAWEAGPDTVSLAWQLGPGLASDVQIQRRESPGEWLTRGAVLANGSGEVRFIDRGLEPDRTYGYRLLVNLRGTLRGDGEDSITTQFLPEKPEAGSPYPNPVRGAFAFRLDVTENGPVRIRLFDVSGRLCMTDERGVLDRGRQTISLTPPAALISGSYFLQVDQGRQSFRHRIMIVR